jgi:hypothetical protein
MPMADMLKKFRAYYHFIKGQQRHKDAFGVHPIRSVLVETTSEAGARSSWNSPNILRLLGPASGPVYFGSPSLPCSPESQRVDTMTF